MKQDKDLLIKQMLEQEGCTDIKFYLLINNSGYTFYYKGKKYDLRHWINVYGAECDFWGFASVGTGDIEFTNKIKDQANEINERE